MPGHAVPQLALDPESGKPKKLPAEAKKNGWEWTGWYGFGGSAMQVCLKKVLLGAELKVGS